MMEERYHATTQNRFYPDMSNVNKNITTEAKLISPPTYHKMTQQYLLFVTNMQVVGIKRKIIL